MDQPDRIPPDPLARSLTRLFFASGATGLVYETVFVKVLGYVFGTTAYAVATVLGAFMVGLALGSLLIGRIAPRVRRPILLYACLELGTAAFCVLTPFWHDLATRAYVSFYRSVSPGDATLTAVRFLLASLIVVVPAALMGGTLPAILKSGLRREGAVARQIGSFYAANLAGAALGTIVSTYLLLPAVGIYGTLACAALVNVAIFVRCLRLRADVTSTAEVEEAPSQAAITFPLALGVAAFSGASSFAYENLFTHVFGTLIGSSVYAFGTMLFTFLAGLAIGGRWTTRCLRQGRGPAALAAALLLTPLAVAATLPLYERIDVLYKIVGMTVPSFFLMEATRFGVCVALVLAPATLLGMVLPLAMELSSGTSAEAPRRVSVLYAVNTLASFAGSVLAGFLLLSWLGSERTFHALGGAGIACGLVVLALLPVGAWKWLWGPAAAAAFAAMTFWLPAWDLQRLTSGRWVYFTYDHSELPIIHHEEDVHGGMVTVTRKDGVVTVWTNGKFQGNNASEVPIQRGFAVYPVLFLKHFDSALGIGLGTGTTAGTLARFPFKEIDVAEIAASMARASAYFAEQNGHVLDDPRVHIHFADGRNYLLMTEKTYDLITVEITSIWLSGAANLYNQEFFEQARRHLRPGGVFQEWVQLHHIDTLDLLLILNTMRQVFPHCAMFRLGHQAIVVASEAPLEINVPAMTEQDKSPRTAVLREGLPLGTLLAYAGDMFLAPDEFDTALDATLGKLGRWRPWYSSRDFLPMLEYNTPKGNALRYSQEANVGYLQPFSHTHLPPFTETLPDRLAGAVFERRGDAPAALLRYEAAPQDAEVTARAAALREALRKAAGLPR